MEKIKTRFAPSPTGELHIGAARTALFNYLFAKNQAGEFLLRIEDTDRERFIVGATERIIESLSWLGIVPDNVDEPMVQSTRLEKYRAAAETLIKNGDAYVCTCSKEELGAERQNQIAKNLPPKYSGKCREKSQITRGKSQTNQKFEIPNGAVFRMKMPESGKIVVEDLIRGQVEFDAGLLDDQIIIKSDGFPTYHLASVVDDHEMEITHVLRAEEWLSSTPKHLILYKMFGWTPPKFGHLSMILGPDQAKLSKRHGATSVLEYRDEGYLPAAIDNFIALLGWNPKTEREIFTLPELVREFKIENVNKSAAVFDIEKLNWMNADYIKNQISKIKMTDENSKILEKWGYKKLSNDELELIGRGGFRTLRDVAHFLDDLYEEPEYNAELLIFKKSDFGKTKTGLEKSAEKLSALENWDEENLEKILAEVVSENNLTNGDVFWPVRVALSGSEKSPSPVELLVALGKEESLERIQKAMSKLK
ncbi:MAG: glutamate--tRNA ligase [Candidatus Berkelbacteria bacterium]|nr:glutamate--tRNA ligase [Candidatus Berkelbacteria bacterium]